MKRKEKNGERKKEEKRKEKKFYPCASHAEPTAVSVLIVSTEH
jgi:hypothetical protein